MGNADPDARRFAIIGSLITVPFIAAAAWVLLGSHSEVRAFLRGSPLHLAEFLVLLAVLVPVHEFIHAMAYLKGMRSPHLIMGAWMRRGMFYVIFDAPMPRHRVLLMCAMPFLLLSVLPALCLPFLKLRHELLALGWFLVLLHSGLCSFDFLAFWRLFFRVPRGAWIYNNGWTTYWITGYEGTL